MGEDELVVRVGEGNAGVRLGSAKVEPLVKPENLELSIEADVAFRKGEGARAEDGDANTSGAACTVRVLFGVEGCQVDMTGLQGEPYS